MHHNQSSEKLEKLADTRAEQAGMARSYESAPRRERTWDECPLEEKAQRLRNELRELRQALQYVISEAHRVSELFDHSHDALGRVVSPVARHGQLSGAGTAPSRYDPLA